MGRLLRILSVHMLLQTWASQDPNERSSNSDVFTDFEYSGLGYKTDGSVTCPSSESKMWVPVWGRAMIPLTDCSCCARGGGVTLKTLRLEL